MRTFTLTAGVVFACGIAIGADKPKADEKLDEKAIVGKWVGKDEHAKPGKSQSTVTHTMELKENGGFLDTTTSKFGDRNVSTDLKGTWKLDGTTLVITQTGTKVQLLWKNMSLKDGKLIHQITDDWAVVYSRPDAKDDTGDDKKPGGGLAKALVGKWTGKLGDRERTVTFLADGTYTDELSGAKTNRTGTYKLDGASLEMTIADQPKAKPTRWTNVAVKDGKLTAGGGGEFTRVDEKKDK